MTEEINLIDYIFTQKIQYTPKFNIDDIQKTTQNSVISVEQINKIPLYINSRNNIYKCFMYN